MTSTPPKGAPSPSSAFELKGRMATLTVLHVQTAELDRLLAELAQRVAEAPLLLRGAPMMIDLDGVEGAPFDLPRLTAEMRALGLVPVAVRGSRVDAESAQAAGLGLLSAGDEEPQARREAPPQQAQAPLPPRVIESPVRSGQQVYARGCGLVVLGAVGTGAEVLADGDIHIYGALRGRALAGVQGEAQARIFCMGLEAELVSVAGSYQVSDRFDSELRGRAAQVRLDDDGVLHIEPFGKTG